MSKTNPVIKIQPFRTSIYKFNKKTISPSIVKADNFELVKFEFFRVLSLVFTEGRKRAIYVKSFIFTMNLNSTYIFSRSAREIKKNFFQSFRSFFFCAALHFLFFLIIEVMLMGFWTVNDGFKKNKIKGFLNLIKALVFDPEMFYVESNE